MIKSQIKPKIMSIIFYISKLAVNSVINYGVNSQIKPEIIYEIM